MPWPEGPPAGLPAPGISPAGTVLSWGPSGDRATRVWDWSSVTGRGSAWSQRLPPVSGSNGLKYDHFWKLYVPRCFLWVNKVTPPFKKGCV